jgi:hypothetical protein
MSARPALESLSTLHARLGAELRARAATLAREVRDYPTPIARCDDQLSGLLERRGRVFRALEAIEAIETLTADEAAAALAALEACAATLEADDLDATFMALWREALDALRAQWRARPGACGPADAWTNDGGGTS